VPGRESELTRSGEPVKGKMTKAPEPKDKLDATTVVAANGPEDAILDWDAVDWRACEESVRRLRQRIFTASQAQDLKRVRNLQKLMLCSRANTLLSVRRVTERNAGRLTAGIDGEVALTSKAKANLVSRMQRITEPFVALPVRRVYIPKKGSSAKRRPLGIPVILDRCRQAMVAGALEPEWEARFEPKSYGFRPGRGCHDAIEAIYKTARGKNPRRRWVLDADLASAFDKIAHDHILAMLGTFPARGMVGQWLKAGVVENGLLARTEEGVPQGGVVSPGLLNVALHGMETAAGVCYQKAGRTAGKTAKGSPVLIRYADDLIALCHTEAQALEVKTRLARWLEPRGLAFNEDKTQIVCLDDGFDFLGFNVRRYRGKLLIKPSKAAVRRFRERLSAEMRSLRGANASAVISRLNPIIRGWAAYYRSAVSSDAYHSLDTHLWRLTYKWAVYSHRNKPKAWIISRHYGMFNKSRRDRWVFGDRHSGAYMQKFAWTRIVRHRMVKGTASPDDPTLATYWAERRRKTTPLPTGKTSLRLLEAQHGRCPLCGGSLLLTDDPPQSPRQWERWSAATRTAIIKTASRADGTSDDTALRLTHLRCHRRHTAGRSTDPQYLHAREPPGLA
jgi:RNA-directed DNA polymerase